MKKEENVLLNSLAKRIDSNCTWWYSCKWSYNKNYIFSPKMFENWFCYICKQCFLLGKPKEIDDHGYFHLKESNLLAFT